MGQVVVRWIPTIQGYMLRSQDARVGHQGLMQRVREASFGYSGLQPGWTVIGYS